MQPPTTHALTPGQATYVITRLLNERRLTTTDITTYLHQLHDDITAIEERLATLRPAAPSRHGQRSEQPSQRTSGNSSTTTSVAIRQPRTTPSKTSASSASRIRSTTRHPTNKARSGAQSTRSCSPASHQHSSTLSQATR